MMHDYHMPTLSAGLAIGCRRCVEIVERGEETSPGFDDRETVAALHRRAGSIGYDTGIGRAGREPGAPAMVALIVQMVADHGEDVAAEALANFTAAYAMGRDDWQPYDKGERG